MNFDDQAIDNIAQCISDGVHLTLDFGERIESIGRCRRCGNLSQAVFQIKGIAEDAVYDLGTVAACGVCDVKDSDKEGEGHQ